MFRIRLTRRGLVKAGAATAGLAACNCIGSGRVSAQDQRWSITLIQGVKADEFYISMACGAQRAADELGVDLTVQAPDAFDATLQTPILNAVVQARPDAILIAPNDRVAMIAPIQDAINAGIAVFTVDTKIEADIALANIASDNIEGGRIAARALAELIGNQGKVYVQNVKAGVSTTDQRQQGFEEEIQNYPDIEYVGFDYNNDDPTTAAAQTAAKLQQHPDLAGIFGTNLFGAEGAATAVREAGKQGQVKIVGFDAGPKQVADLRNEIVDVLIAQHPYDIGYTAVQMAVQYLETQQPPSEKVVTTGYSIVTRDNVDDPEIRRYLYVADCSEIPEVEATPAASPEATPA
ncbi:MAG TPA: ABC transporter substrate-binding protein [Thermomicrobiales bacterium]